MCYHSLMSDKEYIKRLEEANEKLKGEIEALQEEKDEVEEKWRTHEIFDESEMWSLDYTLASFILPRLQALREVKHGYPSELETPEQWNDIMDKMIESFGLIVNDESYPNGESLKNKPKIEEGLKLFAEYFQNLWD